MSDFTMTVGEDLIAVIRFDAIGRTMNTLTNSAWDQLGALIQQVSADPIKGAVIISGKDNGFCAGADLDELILFAGNTPATEQEQRDRRRRRSHCPCRR